MALRLIEISVPEKDQEAAVLLLKDAAVISVWRQELSEGHALCRVLVTAEAVEALLDRLSARYGSTEGFRAILLSVEAAIPRQEEPEQSVDGSATAPEPPARPARISREELYAGINESSRLTVIFLVMVTLSTVVAIIGQIRNNMAVEIGAMVLAPLLGPNIALSLATTLADVELARRALKAAVAGFATALAISVLTAFVFAVDPASPEIASRTHVGLGDVGLALASGVAGALAFTSGVSAALVGVMVAVALLPPLVTFGLLLGAGHPHLAIQAGLLLLTNLICVNLAGVVTFMVQGVRPISWWEASRARTATRFAILLWAAMLLALVSALILSRRP
ncbi:MAG TPA: TIGR00341 family protein [Opitutus sp.]|nr:TIGR00341 family protein [Opitutus sp.]